MRDPNLDRDIRALARKFYNQFRGKWITIDDRPEVANYIRGREVYLDDMRYISYLQCFVVAREGDPVGIMLSTEEIMAATNWKQKLNALYKIHGEEVFEDLVESSDRNVEEAIKRFIINFYNKYRGKEFKLGEPPFDNSDIKKRLKMFKTVTLTGMTDSIFMWNIQFEITATDNSVDLGFNTLDVNALTFIRNSGMKNYIDRLEKLIDDYLGHRGPSEEEIFESSTKHIDRYVALKKAFLSKYQGKTVRVKQLPLYDAQGYISVFTGELIIDKYDTGFVGSGADSITVHKAKNHVDDEFFVRYLMDLLWCASSFDPQMKVWRERLAKVLYRDAGDETFESLIPETV